MLTLLIYAYVVGESTDMLDLLPLQCLLLAYWRSIPELWGGVKLQVPAVGVPQPGPKRQAAGSLAVGPYQLPPRRPAPEADPISRRD